MKKILLFVFCISAAYVASSQTFAPEGSYWHYCSTTWWVGVNHPSYYAFVGVDTMGGKEIKIVIGNDPQMGWPVNDSLFFHVNGDTTFVYEPAHGFTELYNFSLVPGDTVVFTEKNSISYFLDPLYALKYIVSDTGSEACGANICRYYDIEYVTGDGTGLAVKPPFRIKEKIGLISELHHPSLLPYFASPTQDGPTVQLIFYGNDETPNFYGDTTGVCIMDLDEMQVWTGKVYPNPAQELLYVANPYNEALTATLIDISGKFVKPYIFLGASSVTTISMEDVQSGTYILRVIMADGNKVHKTIIKH